MFWRTPLIALTSLLLLMSSCANNQLRPRLLDSMAKLDAAYIPALVFSQLQKEEETALALARLRRVWNDFHLQYYNLRIKYGINITDSFWQENFDTVDAWLTSAEAASQAKNPAAAYVHLERIRTVFGQLRNRNGLDYFLDGLHEFDVFLDELSRELAGKTKFNETELRKLKGLLSKAQSIWTKVAGHKLVGRRYGFDRPKIAAIQQKIKRQQQLLEAFAAALDQGKTEGILRAAKELRPNFIVLYKTFGDFQPVFDAIISERENEQKDNQLDKAKSK